MYDRTDLTWRQVNGAWASHCAGAAPSFASSRIDLPWHVANPATANFEPGHTWRDVSRTQIAQFRATGRRIIWCNAGRL